MAGNEEVAVGTPPASPSSPNKQGGSGSVWSPTSAKVSLVDGACWVVFDVSIDGDRVRRRHEKKKVGTN